MANKRWLESVAAARRNKKRHDKNKQKEIDTYLFICSISKNQPDQTKMQPSTTSPYIRPNHREATLLLRRTKVINLTATKVSILRKNPEAPYIWMMNIGIPTKSEEDLRRN